MKPPWKIQVRFLNLKSRSEPLKHPFLKQGSALSCVTPPIYYPALSGDTSSPFAIRLFIRGSDFATGNHDTSVVPTIRNGCILAFPSAARSTACLVFKACPQLTEEFPALLFPLLFQTRRRHCHVKHGNRFQSYRFVVIRSQCCPVSFLKLRLLPTRQEAIFV